MPETHRLCNKVRRAAKGPAPLTQAPMQRPKGATAAVPVEANGRNPLPKVGSRSAPGPPTSRGSVRRLGQRPSHLRVLLSVQPLTASCRARKPRQPDIPDYNTACANCETATGNSVRVIQAEASYLAKAPGFVGRNGGRQEPDGVQPALFPAALGQQQMSIVHGIEGSAKQA